MFGYIVCNKTELNKEEQMRYQSVYCGLCRALARKYGQIARVSLSYDLTFLALFLSALYEPEEFAAEFRCGVHPFKKQLEVGNPYVEYAADMTILLTYVKCLDDWRDEKKMGRLRYANALKKYLNAIEQKYPRQYCVVTKKGEELSNLEKKGANVADEIVNCSGAMLAEIFVYDEQDYWSPCLRRFGYELGRFIYLMDAVIDYESDLKSGNYNPFVKKDYDRTGTKEILNMVIGNAMEQFNHLPIIQDEKILKNILYRGVWSQYNVKITGKDIK